MTSQPTPEQREAITLRLTDVEDALTSHPQYRASPRPNPSIYYAWDFVMRSKYMLSEYDNIKAGRPLQHPQQFGNGSEGPGTGDDAALKAFQDVCGRTMMLDMLVNDTTGRTAMMTGNPGPMVDFGRDVKNAVKALVEVCPDEHVMAGMMG